MTDIALPGSIEPARRKGPDLDGGLHPLSGIIFMGVIAAATLFVAYSIYTDVDASGTRITTYLPFILLFIALLIALAFEFVNGFHDTANAVATVIYTRALPANFAVVWSGLFNLLGVLASSGAVAFGIVSLLPVELILQVGSSAGFAMVFALLIAAMIWNLGTWYFGLPASSSHTLIGSIIGVGITNALLRGRDGTSGVDWSKATEIGYALLLSPLFGFVMAALLLLLLKFVVRNAALYAEPKGNEPPPWWIRGILILTCTLVSFFHGSNDGQKGMGLIMLILIGTVPTAYALNRAMPASQMEQFLTSSKAASAVIEAKAAGYSVLGNPRPAVTAYVSQHKINEGTFPVIGRSGARHRQPGQSIRIFLKNAGRDSRQYAKRHVPRLRSRPLPDEGQGKRSQQRRGRHAQRLQRLARQRDPIHSLLGKDRRRHRAWSGHDDRVEAHRRHGGREDWQDPSYLCAGRLRRDHRRGDHRSCRRIWAAGLDHPCALVRHRGHHGSERIRPAVGDGAQHRHGLGADAPCRHDDLGQSLLDILPPALACLARLCTSSSGLFACPHHPTQCARTETRKNLRRRFLLRLSILRTGEACFGMLLIARKD
jgi:phosphate/sulfate permease